MPQVWADTAPAAGLGAMRKGGLGDWTGDQLQTEAYILGPGDALALRFVAASELSGPVAVLGDGTASLPLLGNVQLAGLSLAQASPWLQSLYARQLQRPELQLLLTQPRPVRVAVLGEVERPGLYTLSGNEQSQTAAAVAIAGLPTLVDAIQKAGGVTAEADLGALLLQRRLPGAEPRYKRSRPNLLALLRAGDQQQNPLLFDGDTIRVLRAQPAADAATAVELAATSLAPAAIAVTVVGEVKRPGQLELPAGTTLNQAVLAAGGVRPWRANTAELELVRIHRNGTASRQAFRLALGAAASSGRNPLLRDGDTVIVNRSNLARTSDGIAAVSQPISSLTSTWALIDLIQR